ncbi:MAG: hypothetical protein BroJett039_01300 [Chloroflexota bacterium]|nr:MAG: hypothetical protein BroJett039_01300 [Chloroflexota bacterium]
MAIPTSASGIEDFAWCWFLPDSELWSLWTRFLWSRAKCQDLTGFPRERVTQTITIKTCQV